MEWSGEWLDYIHSRRYGKVKKSLVKDGFMLNTREMQTGEVSQGVFNPNPYDIVRLGTHLHLQRTAKTFAKTFAEAFAEAFAKALLPLAGDEMEKIGFLGLSNQAYDKVLVNTAHSR